MARTVKLGSSEQARRSRPALTPEARENQMINKAMRLAERQLEDGTASAQVITHFLKLGTVKNELELEKMRHENALIEAKTQALESSKQTEELLKNALDAFKSYSGYGGPEEYEED